MATPEPSTAASTPRARVAECEWDNVRLLAAPVERGAARMGGYLAVGHAHRRLEHTEQ
jgi:hypothetical protein